MTVLPAQSAGTAETAPVGSSFYLGLRILPRAQRGAMYAIYDFCRQVDDVADGDGPATERMARLDRWSGVVAAIYARRPFPPTLGGLARAVRDYDLARADFDAIIAGMAMDVRGEAIRPDEAGLDLYCDRVASAPGRLSVRVFGLAPEPGRELAHHLGRALQLTNILRDLDEDAGMSRLYLPREPLEAAGIHGSIGEVLNHPNLDGVCRGLAAKASEHFKVADRIMDAAPRAQVRAPRLMAAAYRPLLDRMIARGWAPPRREVRKSKLRIAGALLRYGFV